MTLKRLDNVLIVVDDVEAVKSVLCRAGTQARGRVDSGGPQVGQLIGLEDVRATLAMMRTPDGQGIELDKFHTPTPTYIRGPEGIMVALAEQLG